MSNIINNTTELQEILEALETKAVPSGPDTSDATATSEQILENETAYVKGEKIIGTMPNNGSVSQTFDGITTTSVAIPSGYTNGGTIGLDNTISDEVTEQSDLIDQIMEVIDTLPEAGNGEDVTTETNEYTAKIASLESAVTALEAELAGKAAGGGGNTPDGEAVNYMIPITFELASTNLTPGKLRLLQEDLTFTEIKILNSFSDQQSRTFDVYLGIFALNTLKMVSYEGDILSLQSDTMSSTYVAKAGAKIVFEKL